MRTRCHEDSYDTTRRRGIPQYSPIWLTQTCPDIVRERVVLTAVLRVVQEEDQL